MEQAVGKVSIVKGVVVTDSKHLLTGENVESLSFPMIESQTPAEMAQCDNVWDVTHEQMRRLRLPTAEEIQKIREMAHKEGHAAGEQAGLAAGKKRIDQEVTQLKQKVGQLNQVLNELAQPLAERADQTAEQLTDIVCMALKHILLRELTLDSGGVCAVVQEALTAVEQGAGRVQVRLNPADLAHWQGDNVPGPALDERVKLVGDQRITPGGCLVETSACQVDGTVESRLTQVMEGLYESLSQDDRSSP